LSKSINFTGACALTCFTEEKYLHRTKRPEDRKNLIEKSETVETKNPLNKKKRKETIDFCVGVDPKFSTI
jgi:hypothetical protein